MKYRIVYDEASKRYLVQSYDWAPWSFFKEWIDYADDRGRPVLFKTFKQAEDKVLQLKREKSPRRYVVQKEYP